MPDLDRRMRPERPWLLADIGGTNARFGWMADGSTAVQHVDSLPGRDHAGPAHAARAYLERLAQRLGPEAATPRAAAFAVATAVGADRVAFTNSAWSFSCEDTRRELGLQHLVVVNDFEALALSLPHLAPSQMRTHGAPLQSDRMLAVVGPGTGLGVAGLVPARDGHVAVPGEGGHATLAAADDFEAALLAQVRRTHAHVSAERLLSGIGLPVLHAAVAAVMGLPQALPQLSAGAIVERGVTPGGDAACSATLDAFCGLLGGFAGNVALTLGARGGVCIGGGIVPRFADRFFASRFRERFEAKGRLTGYLQAIPTALITDTLAALTGAAAALEQHGRR